MLFKVVSVRDSAVEAFMPPTFIPHTGAAIREFTAMVNDPNAPFSKHPADFDLYHIADFDDSTARFTLFADPVRLLRGQDVVTNN